MGSTLSTCIYSPIYSSVPVIKENEAFFESLLLSEFDIGRLFRVFQRIDKFRRGAIYLMDILMFLDVDRTPFTERVLMMFDRSKTGMIDFKSFVTTVWYYCTLGKPGLAIFAFDMYDEDGNKDIGREELIDMLKDVYGHYYASNANAMRILNEIDKLHINNLGKVDIQSFNDFLAHHPALLFPAYEIQRLLRHRVVGSSFWKEMSTRRTKLLKNANISPKDLLKMQKHDPSEVYELSKSRSTTSTIVSDTEVVSPLQQPNTILLENNKSIHNNHTNNTNNQMSTIYHRKQQQPLEMLNLMSLQSEDFDDSKIKIQKKESLSHLLLDSAISSTVRRKKSAPAILPGRKAFETGQLYIVTDKNGNKHETSTTSAIHQLNDVEDDAEDNTSKSRSNSIIRSKNEAKKPLIIKAPISSEILYERNTLKSTPNKTTPTDSSSSSTSKKSTPSSTRSKHRRHSIDISPKNTSDTLTTRFNSKSVDTTNNTNGDDIATRKHTLDIVAAYPKKIQVQFKATHNEVSTSTTTTTIRGGGVGGGGGGGGGIGSNVMRDLPFDYMAHNMEKKKKQGSKSMRQAGNKTKSISNLNAINELI
eukprot:gene4645-9216_t